MSARRSMHNIADKGSRIIESMSPGRWWWSETGIHFNGQLWHQTGEIGFMTVDAAATALIELVGYTCQDENSIVTQATCVVGL